MMFSLGSDHRGAQAISRVADKLKSDGHDIFLMTGHTGEPCDYPEAAYLVAKSVSDGQVDLGILICGTGIGMSIAANKTDGVRAAVVHDELTAQISREHNNANVLCLSADLLGERRIEKIVEAWIGASFDGGRHDRRIRKIAAIEQGRNPQEIGE